MASTQLPQTGCLVQRCSFGYISGPQEPGGIAGPEPGIRGRDPGQKAARLRPQSSCGQNQQQHGDEALGR